MKPTDFPTQPVPNPAPNRHDVNSVMHLLGVVGNGRALASVDSSLKDLLASIYETQGDQGKATGSIDIKITIAVDDQGHGQPEITVSHKVTHPKPRPCTSVLHARMLNDKQPVLTLQDPHGGQLFDGSEMAPRGANVTVAS